MYQRFGQFISALERGYSLQGGRNDKKIAVENTLATPNVASPFEATSTGREFRLEKEQRERERELIIKFCVYSQLLFILVETSFRPIRCINPTRE